MPVFAFFILPSAFSRPRRFLVTSEPSPLTLPPSGTAKVGEYVPSKHCHLLAPLELGWGPDCARDNRAFRQARGPRGTIPANLKNRPCFRFRGALPHHNEIAVDEFPKKMTKADYKIQKLYNPPTYARQFTYRYNTARNDILQVFSENWSP